MVREKKSGRHRLRERRGDRQVEREGDIDYRERKMCIYELEGEDIEREREREEGDRCVMGERKK